MYATKPLSLFKGNPGAAASMPPPEGGSSGYLLVKGEDDDDDETRCCGAYRDNRVWELPFPQNCVLKVQYSDDEEAVVFVPVPDQPLASNRYYAVIASGTHKGKVRACSREEDATTCFCRCIGDVKPRPFDPADVYQQIEVIRQRKRGLFTARAVAADGFPPLLYRNKGWEVYAYESKKSSGLGEAPGLDDALRSRWLCHAADELVPAPTTNSAAVVGRWYCPFYLVKEDGVSLRKQVDRGAFYEVVLEQRWDPEPDDNGGSKPLANKKAFIGGSTEARQESSSAESSSRNGDDAYVWFTAAASTTQQQPRRVGLCKSVWERMLWVERRGGWIEVLDNDDPGMVADGSSVLVERFTVKTMDGGVVLAFDFANLTKVRERRQL